MKSLESPRIRLAEILTHVIGWGIIFGFPIFFMNKGNGPNSFGDYTKHIAVPLSFCIIFYINYLFIIPKLLFNQRLKEFLVVNVVLVLIMSAGIYFWQSILFPPIPLSGKPPREGVPPRTIFVLRDMLSMILTIALATAIKLIGRWSQIENERREAERARSEAELKNLRSQLNPHFLLNTLNNIYALIAFDSDKAQQAVQELSKLLRHVLYNNQQPFVSLGKEMDFIRNYIELMRIRLSPNVTVKTEINISADSRTQIAPLIFISLIENAFKHGISPTEPSMVLIAFSESENQVKCIITNSNHPKSSGDKSGSGIGLNQVSKRLELLYPHKYKWIHGVSEDGKSYTSQLVIEV